MREMSFHEIEHAAWSQRAAYYDDLFADVSAQNIAQTLNSLGSLTGRRYLDVACGTGHLVAAAARRGAISEGVDFAQPMIEVARTNYPACCFKVADAAHLPYEDAVFEAVTCAFGLSHMENPLAAISEAFRVLIPGGRFAFTLWFGAEDGGELQAIGKEAISSYATKSLTFPRSWTQLRFADRQVCTDLVRRAGFNTATFETLPLVMKTIDAQVVLDMLSKLSIRTKLIFDSQPSAVRQRINEHILAEVETRRVDGIISIRWPALLTVVQKPE